MVNTGTWNSELAVLFILAFFSPIFLHMCVGVIVQLMYKSEDTYLIDVYQQKTKKKKDFVKTAPSKPATIETMAIEGLVKLGYKKSQSRMLVARLCAKNRYEKAEHIIIDAIKCV